MSPSGRVSVGHPWYLTRRKKGSPFVLAGHRSRDQHCVLLWLPCRCPSAAVRLGAVEGRPDCGGRSVLTPRNSSPGCGVRTLGESWWAWVTWCGERQAQSTSSRGSAPQGRLGISKCLLDLAWESQDPGQERPAFERDVPPGERRGSGGRLQPSMKRGHWQSWTEGRPVVVTVRHCRCSSSPTWCLCPAPLSFAVIGKQVLLSHSQKGTLRHSEVGGMGAWVGAGRAD